MVRFAFLIFVVTGLLSCAAQKATDMVAAKAKISSELESYLSSEGFTKQASSQGLAGSGAHSYTIVVGKGGKVETVLSNQPDKKQDYNQQNNLTRLIRQFQSSQKLLQNERVRLEQQFTL